MSLFAYFNIIARLEELKNEVNEDWLRHQRKLLNKECEIYRNFVRGQIRERDLEERLHVFKERLKKMVASYRTIFSERDSLHIFR